MPHPVNELKPANSHKWLCSETTHRIPIPISNTTQSKRRKTMATRKRFKPIKSQTMAPNETGRPRRQKPKRFRCICHREHTPTIQIDQLINEWHTRMSVHASVTSQHLTEQALNPTPLKRFQVNDCKKGTQSTKAITIPLTITTRLWTPRQRHILPSSTAPAKKGSTTLQSPPWFTATSTSPTSPMPRPRRSARDTTPADQPHRSHGPYPTPPVAHTQSGLCLRGERKACC